MSVKAMTWVFEHSPYTLGTRLVHLAIADIANEDNDWLVWVSHTRIAAKAKVSRTTVVAATDKMVRDRYLDLVERHPGGTSVYRFLRPEVSDSAQPTCQESDTTCQVDRAEPDQLTDPLSLITKQELKRTLAPKQSDPLDVIARRIVQMAWDNRPRKPTARFMALVGMARKFLDAGASERDLTSAFMRTRAFTEQSIEFELNSHTTQSRTAESAVLAEIEELVNEGK